MAYEHFHQVQEDLRQPYAALREAAPGVMSAYSALERGGHGRGRLVGQDQGAHRAGHLHHPRVRRVHRRARAGAARRGATTEEVAEMIGVAISMNGGPGTVWGPRALAAFQEFFGG